MVVSEAANTSASEQLRPTLAGALADPLSALYAPLHLWLQEALASAVSEVLRAAPLAEQLASRRPPLSADFSPWAPSLVLVKAGGTPVFLQRALRVPRHGDAEYPSVQLRAPHQLCFVLLPRMLVPSPGHRSLLRVTEPALVKQSHHLAT